MGVGKSYIIQGLTGLIKKNNSPKIKVLLTDVGRKALIKMGIIEYNKRYEEESMEMVYKSILETARRETSNGKTIIVDATFKREDIRRRFMDMAKQKMPFVILNVTAEDKTIIKRLKERESDKTHSEATEDTFKTKKDSFEKLSLEEMNYVLTIDNNSEGEGVLRKAYEGIMKKLGTFEN